MYCDAPGRVADSEVIMLHNRKLVPIMLLAFIFGWALYNLLGGSGYLPVGTGTEATTGDDGSRALPQALEAEVASLDLADEVQENTEWLAMITQAASGAYYKDARDRALATVASRALASGRFGVAITAAEVMFHPGPREEVLEAVAREAALNRANLKYAVRAARGLVSVQARREIFAQVLAVYAERDRPGAKDGAGQGAGGTAGSAPGEIRLFPVGPGQ